MDGFLITAGLISIALTVLYLLKRMVEYADMRLWEQRICYENYDIYKAAQRFALGSSLEEVKELLVNSYELDKEQIEQAIALALPYRDDSDGGYQAFTRAVNRVLGENVYI
jgi:hypothetical protein